MALRATRTLLMRVTQPPSPARQTKPRPTTILEVERKFRRLAVPTLTDICTTTTTKNHSNRYCYKYNPNPNFRSVVPLPTRTIHDIYYDTPDHTLCTSGGAWIRRRNGEWQAKLKRGGDFVNSRFEELRGAREIGNCIRSILGGVSSGGGVVVFQHEGENNFGLEKLAEFVTTREAWLVDGEFKVVRDRMDFGHEVGEVELQVEVPIDEAEKERGAVMMEEMDRRIEGFMKRYAWVWETGEAVGKLTAYFEMMMREKNGGV
ncbi:CYTH-like domain-containing protein [Chaetomium strumarium]|uniref:Thiamine-triphosphatase n=1 Tax=Chaetomium strumarium TaxID=1170767 RepID=A0AAJ0GV23_9PEZI|nr:CYTH-like domain-containing protein [Chaetomium strumarium]